MTERPTARLPMGWLDSLSLPAIAAPMFLVSSPRMVVEACRSGVIGSMPTVNARTPEILDAWLAEMTAEMQAARSGGATLAPWALGLTTHSSNQRLAADLAIVAKYQPPLVVTAMGSPKPALETVHAYGGVVFADVSTIDHARKAAAAGADGLVLVCAGAGGHTGQIAAPAFVAAVRAFFDGVIVIGGAISDGASIRAAQIMGADLVYLGTRLIACTESTADPRYKQMVVEASAKDLVMTNVLTGAWSHCLRSSLEAVGLDPDNLEKGNAFDLDYAKKKPKAWKEIWSAGQGVGAVMAEEPLAQIIDQLCADYAAVLRAEVADPWMRKYEAAKTRLAG